MSDDDDDDDDDDGDDDDDDYDGDDNEEPQINIACSRKEGTAECAKRLNNI